MVFSSQILFIKFHFVNNILVITLVSSIIIALIAFLFFKIAINKNKEYINNLEIEFEELTKSNERYDIVAKATSDTIWDWDLKTGGFIWNKGIETIFGYKKEDVGENLQWWFDKIHPEDSLKMSVKLYSFIAEKSEKWQDEYRFCCADGSYKYIFDRGFLVKDESDNIVRMIGAMQDVTKQKEEEQRLKLLETVIIQTKDSVIITEGTGINSELPNIVYVNPAFSKMTGYQDKEVIGSSLSSFMNGVLIRNELIKLKEALKKKEEFSFESINTRKNGEEYWVNFIIIPITDKENQHSHWISIQRDISVEKEREKERESLISELTQNNKDLKQFSYITSHNLRAPLSNLTGLLNLIEDVPIENEELKEIINGFSKSTNQLNETINDLVNVIIIKDSPSIQKEDIIIKDVFENVFSQLSFLISIKKPIIKIDFHDSEIINLNKSYIESILLNLMTNSLRYFDPKKQLKITISSKKTDLETIILFTDNGIGIDLDRNKDKIFGLYQRFHDYPDSKGLGLYLVKSQVESMGGKISVESQVGIGTTFTITFKNK
ncbi:MAG: PAS domain-containing protein [Flavobacterium sp.]